MAQVTLYHTTSDMGSLEESDAQILHDQYGHWLKAVLGEKIKEEYPQAEIDVITCDTSIHVVESDDEEIFTFACDWLSEHAHEFWDWAA